jgi:hypothetical protein
MISIRKPVPIARQARKNFLEAYGGTEGMLQSTARHGGPSGPAQSQDFQKYTLPTCLAACDVDVLWRRANQNKGRRENPPAQDARRQRRYVI